MQVRMNSDIKASNHRRLETAFAAAADARNKGAQEVMIEWDLPKKTIIAGSLCIAGQYAFEKTSDGIYARLRGCTTAEEIMRVHTLALKHGLPFTPTASWARTDGTPVTEVSR